ncbi:hypothetical protein D3C79_967780 [compost metagenome]
MNPGSLNLGFAGHITRLLVLPLNQVAEGMDSGEVKLPAALLHRITQFTKPLVNLRLVQRLFLRPIAGQVRTAFIVIAQERGILTRPLVADVFPGSHD